MGLFSDIISSVGNAASDIFGGGGDDNNNKRRQQNAPAPAPSVLPTVKLPAVLQAPQQQQNPLRPVNVGPAPGSNPLQLQQPTAPAAAPSVATTQYAPPSQSLTGQLLHGAANAGGTEPAGVTDCAPFEWRRDLFAVHAVSSDRRGAVCFLWTASGGVRVG